MKPALRNLVSAISLLAVFSLHSSAQVTITISPTQVTLATLATQSFTATVSGSTNTAVNWEVNGIAGGSPNAGLISTTVFGTSNEGIYLAPSTVPAPATVSVTAVSQPIRPSPPLPWSPLKCLPAPV